MKPAVKTRDHVVWLPQHIFRPVLSYARVGASDQIDAMACDSQYRALPIYCTVLDVPLGAECPLATAAAQPTLPHLPRPMVGPSVEGTIESCLIARRAARLRG